MARTFIYLGNPCPICKKPMYKRSDGSQVCLSKWLHRTIDDIKADIADMEGRLRQASKLSTAPSEQQQADAAYWLDNPQPLMIQAQRDRLAYLRAELAYRQAGGPPIPDLGYKPLPCRGMSSPETVTARPRAAAASKPSKPARQATRPN